MSSLQAAFEQKKEILKGEGGLGKQKVRLVADPFIGVSDIENALSRYCQHQKCSDIHALLCAPASLVHITWQTPPHPEWMLKLSPLIFEVLEFAPQTKLQGTKVKKALQALLHKKLCTYSGKEGLDTIVDRCDLCLRMVLNMYRDVKSKPLLRQRVMRNLSRDDGLKLSIVLDRVQLPLDHMDSQETAVSASGGEPGLLALEDGDPSMDPVEKQLLVQVNPETARPALKRSLQFVSSSLPSLDPIFQKILQESEEEVLVKPEQKVVQEKKLSGEELLLNAINFVPEQVEKKLKKGNKAQEPKAKSKPGKAAKVPVAKAKKSVKKQKKKQIVAKKPAALSFSKKDKELKVVKEVVQLWVSGKILAVHLWNYVYDIWISYIPYLRL